MFASAFYLSRDTLAGLLRLHKDKQAAEEYLKLYLIDVTDTETGSFPAEVSPIETEDADTEESREDPSFDPVREEFSDDQYYQRDGVTYTPDFAEGTLDCVLEIPSIGLRRGVYTGTQNEIDHDLGIWLTTVSRPELELGKTHYAIYGHNHPVQNLSFNRLKDVKLGDRFTLTKEGNVYLYTVTDIFAEWRHIGRKKYAEDLSQNPSLCYIFTCGRDYWPLNGESTRYKDYIVKGELKEIMALRDWDELEEISREGELYVPEIKIKARHMSVLDVTAKPKENSEEFTILASLTDKSGNPIKDSILSLMDADGNEVRSWVQTDSPKELSVPEGTWVIGVTKIAQDYYVEPPGKEIIITSKDIQINRIGTETKETLYSWSEIQIITMFSMIVIGAFAAVFLLNSCKKKEDEPVTTGPGTDQPGQDYKNRRGGSLKK